MTHIKDNLSRNKLGELLVSGGHISQTDLKKAVKHHKLENIPIGQAFIELGFVSKKLLTFVLLKQRCIRIAAAVFFMFAAMGHVNKSKADSLKALSKKITVSLELNNVVKQKELEVFPALFGSSEKLSDDLKAFTKWESMFERFEQSLIQDKQGHFVKRLHSELEGFQSSSILKKAQKVNTIMNEKKYILDKNNWGKSDYWATPIEFMERGGDCEDFAIAKYMSLKALGVPESRLRLAIVQDERKDIPHAVLIVYAENGPVVLDNQNEDVLAADSIFHYRPIFSINRDAWWLHTREETVIASR
ncbi:MAG: transglutaminase-like cysteine peptidase [Alphaproteobacteria bacterium]|nr:transglutaminase-like cysteine peptidase [Alphaproteobacteria bacterium]